MRVSFRDGFVHLALGYAYAVILLWAAHLHLILSCVRASHFGVNSALIILGMHVAQKLAVLGYSSIQYT